MHGLSCQEVTPVSLTAKTLELTPHSLSNSFNVHSHEFAGSAFVLTLTPLALVVILLLGKYSVDLGHQSAVLSLVFWPGCVEDSVLPWLC